MWNALPITGAPTTTTNTPAQQQQITKTKIIFTTKVDRLEHAIAKNEWDVDAWITLLHETKDYTRFLEHFPTSVNKNNVVFS